MFNALICYVINACPEVPRLCKMLEGVVRQMVKNRPLKEMKFHVENILPEVQRHLESRDDLIPLSEFVPIDPLAHQVDPLELSLETTPLSQRDQIQCLRTDDIELDSEGAQGLAHKRRRLSL
jgi:hypothetical protein